MIVVRIFDDGFHIEGHADKEICAATSFLGQTIIHYWNTLCDFHAHDGTTWMKLHYGLPRDPQWETTMMILEQGMTDLMNTYPHQVRCERIASETPQISL